ncbi:MAG: biosynthetic-type acetolactate synthase large subunit [Polyangiaceae bacterium]|jgi:acetolactate synthase-1/2/3 large subunit
MTQSQHPSGAKALVQGLEREGVKYIFGLPGGAAIPIFDALVESPIKLVLVRHEQGATHMADGFARASGRPGVVVATSGPGATNTVSGLLTAHMDSVPIVVLTGQVVVGALGTDGFQEADVTGITYPVVKHSYLVKDPNDIPRVLREAFHIATTGRPGPVLIDLPKDVASKPCTESAPETLNLPGYTLIGPPDPRQFREVADLIMGSRRPVLYVGHGAVISGAGEAILALAEKVQAPVVNTLLGKGAVDETHPLHLGMLGMHGTAYANSAVMNCDLIIAIGARWDDRITGKVDEFCTAAKRVHIDVDPAEFNKVVKADVCVLGDARAVVEGILPLVSRADTKDWLAQCDAWRAKYPLNYSHDHGLPSQYVLDRLNHLTHGEAIITTDVGQHQMWAAQFCRTKHNRTWISSGGAGTMGYGFPAAIGAQLARPDRAVWAIVGDGGFQMTLCELATAANLKLPVKVLIINNHYLGMVRQWQELFFDNRYSGVDLEGNPDFVKLAEAYGVRGLRIDSAADVDRVLAEAAAIDDGPCVINAEVAKEGNVYPMIPAGAPLSRMLIGPPTVKLEKPTGST